MSGYRTVGGGCAQCEEEMQSASQMSFEEVQVGYEKEKYNTNSSHGQRNNFSNDCR